MRGVIALLGMFGLAAAASAADGPAAVNTAAQNRQELIASLTREGLKSGKAHAMLTDLCTNVGPRLSGSEGAEKAVVWAKKAMETCGLDRVRLERIMVPCWVRGPVETAVATGEGLGAAGHPLRVCALGGSVGTGESGVSGEVLEVHSFDELRAAGDKARGKIIFFNRPIDASVFETFPAYRAAVDQRGSGANEAAKAGGFAALVRSMTTRLDDVPHTGAVGYDEGARKVAAAAVSTVGAEWLSAALKKNQGLNLRLTLSCETKPDVPSANVLGEIVGSEKPDEVVVVGGHLDSWDKGQGAHDDGAGCVHSLEALRLIKKLGLRPKRTIRAVLFMNEENGNRGGETYASVKRPGETHIAAIESDEGGFMPRGYGVAASPEVFEVVSKWSYLFTPIEADRFRLGGGAGDIGPLIAKGVPGLSLRVNPQRYFDFHHSDNDTIDGVNERELELGAVTVAAMSYLIAEDGLPTKAPQ